MAYKVDRHVPLSKARVHTELQITFASMKPGDSIFIPAGTRAEAYARKLAHRMSFHLAPRRFISRTVSGGNRIWRQE